MRQAVWQFLRIPPEIREEFWQNSLQKNRLSLLVICIMIFGMELYNMARVLFLSSSGLGTLNNRIYFGMYCSLLMAAALSLALQQLTRRASSGVQWAVQYVSVLFFLLWHICIMIFGMELYNMARVLFLSNSGLGTLNNRIYFGMYCSLLLAAALSLALQQLTRRASSGVQWAVQYVSVLFFFLWHICLNAYDLSRSPGGATITFLTAVLGLAVFIQMPARYSIPCYGGGWALFLLLTRTTLDSGDRINLTFTAIVAMAVSLTTARHAVITLSQRREIREINYHLQKLLELDPLTGLLNKTAFQARAEARLARGGEALTLFMLDLDGFKAVNDVYGHPCGDFVLQEAGLRLRSVLPPDTDIGRIGGDEFAALLPGARGAAELERTGGRLIREISAILWQERDVGAGCSVGICQAARPGASYAQLYREADQALYRAKRQGRGMCVLTRLPE